MNLDDLVVTLSLDPTKFLKGSKEGTEALHKFKGEAKKAADDTERSAGKMADGFSRVTKEVLGLGLAIAGASSLKSLVVGTVQAADSVNLLSRAMGLNEAITSKWVNTARRAGVDTGAAQGAFRSLTVAAGAVMARVPGAVEAAGVPFMQALGIENPQFNDPDRLAAQIVKGFQQSGKSPGDLLAIAQHIPGGEMFLQIAKEFKTVEALNKALADSVTTTHEQAEAARQLTKSMTELQQAVEKKLNELIPVVAPTAMNVIEAGKKAVNGDVSGLEEINAGLGMKADKGRKELWQWMLDNLIPDTPVGKFIKENQGGRNAGAMGQRFRPAGGPDSSAEELYDPFLDGPGPRRARRHHFPGLGPGASFGGDSGTVYNNKTVIEAVNLMLPPGTKDPQTFVDYFTSSVSAIQAASGPR